MGFNCKEQIGYLADLENEIKNITDKLKSYEKRKMILSKKKSRT